MTDDTIADTTPSLSRDGRKIVWVSNGMPGQIKVMDVSGEGKRVLVSGAYSEYPAISNDGSQVAFIKSMPEWREIYVVNSAGGTPRQITSDYINKFYAPAWSSDGQSLVYAALSSTASSPDSLYRVSINGGPPQLLLTRPNISSVAISPTGQIVFTTVNTYRSTKLFLANADGSNVRDITNGEQGGVNATVSPDGLRIAFSKPTTVSADGRSAQVAIVIRSLTGGPETILKEKGAYPSWGRKINP